MDVPPPVEAATTTESEATAAAPSTAAAANETPDLAAAMGSITSQLPQMLEALGGLGGATGAAADTATGKILKNVCEQLPKFVEQLPPNLRAQMSNAELDLGATLASSERPSIPALKTAP